MKDKRVHIKSFGCQMNKLDTALVTSALKDAGFSLTDSAKDADAVLINTCSVRDHAEQRVISHLGHLKHLKGSKPELTVAVMGCMAQRLGNELLDHDAVDIVAGPAQIPQITDLLTKSINEKQKLIAITPDIRASSIEHQESNSLETFESIHDSDDKQLPNQAFVRAMRGCDNFCSYCIVPYVRGPETSRPPKAIIDQIKNLASQSVKLITLLGQKINSYEYTAGDKTYCLADLLEMASKINGIEWIRFVTSYPTEKYFKEILTAMANLPRVCNHLHIPAQSGSDKILKAMNRRYTVAQYLALLDTARNIVGDIAVASDFIVGFPSETDDDFAATACLIEKARFKNSFIFKYSPRPGTKADKKLADNIDDETKKQRNIKLLEIQEKISSQFAQKFLGKTVKVLVEGLSKKPHLNQAQNNNPQLIGRTADDWIVVFNGPQSLAGQFTDVKITKTSPLTLFGQI